METECAGRWIVPCSVFTYQWPCLCVHAHSHTHTQTQHVGGGGNWTRFIAPITALYPLGSTLLQEHQQGLITVCGSRYGAVCAPAIHCPPASGFIQPHTPFFQGPAWQSFIYLLGWTQDYAPLGPWWDSIYLREGWRHTLKGLLLQDSCFRDINAIESSKRDTTKQDIQRLTGTNWNNSNRRLCSLKL